MSGWIEWAGGENPAPGGKVDVKLSDGRTEREVISGRLMWRRPMIIGPSIIAYRLVTEPETLGPSASFWSNVRTEPEAQPPGDGFQLSSEERGAVFAALNRRLKGYEGKRDKRDPLADDSLNQHEMFQFGVEVMLNAIADVEEALSRKERES